MTAIEPVRVLIDGRIWSQSIARNVLGKREPVAVAIIAPILDPVLIGSGRLFRFGKSIKGIVPIILSKACARDGQSLTRDVARVLC